MLGISNDTNTGVLDNSPVQHEPVVSKFTTNGNAFIEKATHPPSGVEGFLGPPDFSNVPFAPVEWRNLDICSPTGNGYIGGGSSVNFGSDNYLFLTPSGARVTTIAFSVGATSVDGLTTTTAVVQDLANTFVNNNYDFGTVSSSTLPTRWNSDVSASRMTAASVTTTLNATAFGDKGLVSVAQFRPVVLFRGPAAAFMEKSSKEVKRAFEKCHDHISDKALHRWGAKRVLSASMVGHGLEDVSSNLTFSADAHIQIFQLSGFNDLGPTSPGQLLQVSAKSYGDIARKGSFSVQRYLDMYPRWMDSSDTQTNSDLYSCYACHRQPDGSLYFVALLEPSRTPGVAIADALPLRDTVWHEMTWVWTLYAGVNRIPITPTLPPSLDFATAAPIIKRIHAYQLAPSLRSPFQANVHAPLDPDIRCLEEMARIWHHMPDALESRFNFLGGLVTMGRTLAASPAVKPFLDKVLDVAGGATKKLVSSAGQAFLGDLLGTKVAPKKNKARTKVAKAEDKAIAAAEGTSQRVADVQRRAANSKATVQRPARPAGVPKAVWAAMMQTPEARAAFGGY